MYAIQSKLLLFLVFQIILLGFATAALDILSAVKKNRSACSPSIPLQKSVNILQISGR